MRCIHSTHAAGAPLDAYYTIFDVPCYLGAALGLFYILYFILYSLPALGVVLPMLAHCLALPVGVVCLLSPQMAAQGKHLDAVKLLLLFGAKVEIGNCVEMA